MSQCSASPLSFLARSQASPRSPETINAEGAQVEREADEAQPPVGEEAEAEAVIEPSSETLAELPVVAIQANQAETLAEETEGVLKSGVVGEEMVFTDVEPQATVPQAGAPSSEVEVEVPVVPSSSRCGWKDRLQDGGPEDCQRGCPKVGNGAR
ncbi:hypothetical protein Nepgr_010345 [Nepenthes gracilis]|uniref:Uncharacterized protein n=1 Tax=Nepenthes gracilis TaxID=150966 RepID=A0AAD3XL82_NEPGR|nr:hypothetical protein Nepgr_010345 [Nepenthes gracilis]